LARSIPGLLCRNLQGEDLNCACLRKPLQGLGRSRGRSPHRHLTCPRSSKPVRLCMLLLLSLSNTYWERLGLTALERSIQEAGMQNTWGWEVPFNKCCMALIFTYLWKLGGRNRSWAEGAINTQTSLPMAMGKSKSDNAWMQRFGTAPDRDI